MNDVILCVIYATRESISWKSITLTAILPGSIFLQYWFNRIHTCVACWRKQRTLALNRQQVITQHLMFNTTYLSNLPWIFPGAPLKFDGAPGNIQGNLTALHRRISTSEGSNPRQQRSSDRHRLDIDPTRKFRIDVWSTSMRGLCYLARVNRWSCLKL